MHTSAPHAAPEQDLFGDAPPAQPGPAGLVAIEGVLREDARVVIQACDHGHARPCVVLELDQVGPGQHRVHVEQPYPADKRFLADAAAAALRRGMSVRVCSSLYGSRLTLPHAESVTPLTHPSTHHHPAHP